MVIEAVQQATWRDWAPIGSGVIAGLSFVVAASNRKIARRALRVGESQEARRQARLDLHLLDTLAWSDAEGDRFGAVQMRFVNPTDRETSLFAADLHLTTMGDGGELTVIQVPHVPDPCPPVTLQVAEIPLPVGANGAAIGWFVFPIGPNITGSAPITRFEFLTQDSRGISAVLQIGVFREVVDERS